MVHLGGDEINTSCFNENPDIKSFMMHNKLNTYNDLINFHISKTRSLLNSVNPKKVAAYWCNEDTFY